MKKKDYKEDYYENAEDEDYKDMVEPDENTMTHDMEEVRELGREMEQLSQNADYPIDTSNDESHEEQKENNE